MATSDTIALQELVGVNAKRIRHELGLTLDQVAIAARSRGLKWTESRVGDLEAGKVSPNLATLIALCLALTDVGGRDVSLPELVSGPLSVKVNDSTVLPASDISRLMQGLELKSLPKRAPMAETATEGGLRSVREEAIADLYNQSISLQTLNATHRSSGATEKKVANSMGISVMLLNILSTWLWKRSFAAERDRRAGPEAIAQVRGRVSRDLKAELETEIRKALGNGND